MQTFLPYTDFKSCARVLDDKRLGKQRVECLQILKALQPPEVCPMCQGRKMIDIRWTKSPQQKNVQCPMCRAEGVRARAWSNHPATRMWRGYTNTLINYCWDMCDEWRRRGFDDSVAQTVAHFVQHSEPGLIPPWLGDERLHASHRAALLYKLPSHYSQFSWTETPKQDYYWPV